MKHLLIPVLCLFLLLLIETGCSPYPRYRKDPEVTPKEMIPNAKYITTKDYIKLGLILQRHLGKPYKGKSKWEEGLDCSKFTRDVFREYDKRIIPRTVKEQIKQGEEVSRRRLNFGDLVFFMTERNRVSHVGVYIGHNEFIHASTSRGVIISNLNETYWTSRYVAARRILSPTGR